MDHMMALEQRILTLIDSMVEQGSDDELFASGYLRGHVTMAVATLEDHDNPPPQAVYQAVCQHLEQAIADGELSPPDQALVRGVWQRLWQQALPG